jgi:ATP-binding cassette, subfamily C (CFTR/MRP), member 1
MLPMTLSFFAPTLVALDRVGKFLTAEELGHPYLINEDNSDAITVDGDFTWESVEGIERPDDEEELDATRKMLKAKEKAEKEKAEKERKKREAKEAKKRKKEGKEVLPTTTDESEKTGDKDNKPKEEPFALKDLKLSVPRGAFVGIIGRVGSGKARSTFILCFGISILRVSRARFFKH